MARGENYVLRKLIEDLQSIQRECDPGAVQAAQEQGKDKMDAFEAHKRDLTFMIVELKKNVERRNELMQNYGRQEQTIRLRAENEKSLNQAKLKFNEMRKAHDVQVAKKRGKRLPDAVLQTRKEMIDILEADIKDLDQSHNQVRPNRGGNRDVAKNLKESRLREKEEDIKQGKESKEPIPMRELTAEAHQFHMQKEEHDVKVDAQLDVIRTGVRDLHELAVDMNDELNVQAVVTQEINKQFDVLDKKFKTANQRMNTLLEQTGGTARWCALMIAFVILMALLAYIFQIIGK
uniref:t-SNARE coiled-coil homology domain-containing protein n=2 Tax=Spongospora subterranea TaxID=70186 RepID=A0A0H5R6W2_9EUKA|eukprot:CRZ09571.1 hypothetical protein [Spongospora subterranea]